MHCARLLWICGLTATLAGCQCCGFTEDYQDLIDCIADRQPHADHLYHPGLDLTRIGYPDWCQCRFNRWICGDCCRDCRRPPAYIPMPYCKMATVPTQTQFPAIPPAPAAEESEPIPETPPDMPDQLQPLPDPKQLEEGQQVPVPPEPGLREDTPVPGPVPTGTSGEASLDLIVPPPTSGASRPRTAEQTRVVSPDSPTAPRVELFSTNAADFLPPVLKPRGNTIEPSSR